MWKQIQKNIPYAFARVKLLEAALTHSSFANELPDPGGEGEAGEEHNERLEFLGDAVLELCVSDVLFKRFPDTREGRLTAMRSRLVKQETLAALARKIGIPEALRLGKGEESQGGRKRDSLLSDAFEALLGAIYLDGGFSAVQEVVRALFTDEWPQQEEKKKSKDNKSRLQEVTQERFKDRPVYTLLKSSGPEHAKMFEVRLELPDKSTFVAVGTSVKRAEQTAALTALAALGEREGRTE